MGRPRPYVLAERVDEGGDGEYGNDYAPQRLPPPQVQVAHGAGGPDPEAHLAAIREFEAAGYDHVYVHQVGPDQEGFLDFYAREILGL
jgi:hypothetical protein